MEKISTCRYLLMAVCAALTIACTSPPTAGAKKSADTVDCTEPRPKICHKMLRPVCATRDNGVRCVTTPCDSTDEVTFANECLACADPAVYFYRDGACSEKANGG